MTDVLVDYQGNWGMGDLLCSDPMMPGLINRHGPATRIWLRGKVGNVIHNPLVAGMADAGQRFDHIVRVQLFTHMDRAAYGRLEAMPSLIAHMCSYAGVDPQGRRPRLHLTSEELAARELLPTKTKLRVALCADRFDPRRHWPVERWQAVAAMLEEAGAEVVGVGLRHRPGVGRDFVGALSMRETAAVLTSCDLFVGNNSGLFHYAQAAGVPCVTLFSLATPSRFVHPGASVEIVEAEGLSCLHCTTRRFDAMQQSVCTAAPRARCMTDIAVDQVTDAIGRALQANVQSASAVG